MASIEPKPIIGVQESCLRRVQFLVREWGPIIGKSGTPVIITSVSADNDGMGPMQRCFTPYYFTQYSRV